MAQNKAMGRLAKTLNGVVAQVAKSEGDSLVLKKDSVMFSVHGHDITTEVLAVMKKQG